MAWTEPKTWTTEPLLSSDLNTHLRDNLNALKEPATSFYQIHNADNYTLASSAWTELDPLRTLTLYTSGGDVMVGVNLSVRHPLDTTLSRIYFDIYVDGVARAGGDGLACTDEKNNGATSYVAFTVLVRNLAAGTHTIKLYWKRSGGSTVALLVSPAMSGLATHPQLWAREVS